MKFLVGYEVREVKGELDFFFCQNSDLNIVKTYYRNCVFSTTAEDSKHKKIQIEMEPSRKGWEN